MIYFIGAGPGDPKLITVKGRELLEQATCIVYAGSLVNPALLSYAPDTCACHNSAPLTLEQTHQLLVEAHQEPDSCVVRLHTGDPSLYGAIHEQIVLLNRDGIEVEVVPGVSSFVSAAASLQTELTIPDISQTVVVSRIEGKTPVPESQSPEHLAKLDATYAFFLSVGAADSLCARLMSGGLSPDTPAHAVYKASWPDERRIRSTLKELPQAIKQAGLHKTTMILVGRALDTSMRIGDVRSKLYDPSFSHQERKATQSTSELKNSPKEDDIKKQALFHRNVHGRWALYYCTIKGGHIAAQLAQSLIASGQANEVVISHKQGGSAQALRLLDDTSASSALSGEAASASAGQTSTGAAALANSPTGDSSHAHSSRGPASAVNPSPAGAACANHPSTQAITLTEEVSVGAWAHKYFGQADCLVVIGSTGIAVRAIAPYVNSKTSDPAVVVVDEAAQWAIPVLSGHLGGAVGYADTISGLIGAHPIHTTATDVRNITPVDSWARAHEMKIESPEKIVTVAATQLKGHEVGVAVTDRLIETPYEQTLFVRPQSLVVGVGCKRGVKPEVIRAFVEAELKQHGYALHSVAAVASIDLKADEKALIRLAADLSVPFLTFSAQELQAVSGSVSSSAYVHDKVGVDCVCERAALAGAYACAGSDAQTGDVRVSLVVSKQTKEGLVTFALAQIAPQSLVSHQDELAKNPDGWLAVVGFGPGGPLDMTKRARETIAAADVVCGYKTYLDLLKPQFPHKQVVGSTMRQEVQRCREALKRAAQGEHVALVCSGDSGIYGMASLVYELCDEDKRYADLKIDIVGGVSASLAGAAILGAPLGHDYSTISLSDLLTPWELIAQRLDAAARSDMVICLYNPRSKGRPHLLDKAVEIISQHRDPKATVCGWVRNAGREEMTSGVCSLNELVDQPIDMLTTVFIGSSQTYLGNLTGKMVTPRGYRLVQGDDDKKERV